MSQRIVPVRVPVWVLDTLTRRAELSGRTVEAEAGAALRESLPELAAQAVRERLDEHSPATAMDRVRSQIAPASRNGPSPAKTKPRPEPGFASGLSPLTIAGSSLPGGRPEAEPVGGNAR